MDKIKLEIKKWLINEKNNNRKSRAELIAFLIEDVYEFVKTEGAEGDILKGSDEAEHQGIGNILDVADDYLFNTVMELNKKETLDDDKR